MKINFKSFDNSYYEKVRDFLIEISQENSVHINWNWARWEWMYFHPEFDRSLIEKIGLWFSGENLVGAAIYDYYLGEAFLAARKGFEELEQDILKYAIDNFCDENGLGIAVNDMDVRTKNLLEQNGFVKNEQTENILELTLKELNFEVKAIEGIILESIDIKKDLYQHQELLWKGFDHEGLVPLDEAVITRQKRLLSAPHLNPFLHVIAKNQYSEYVSYCGLWYDKKTDYAYVEPVCTIPKYRRQKIAKAVLTEALRRAKELGAKKAYVISDNGFYKSLGFQQYSHYTFFWFHS